MAFPQFGVTKRLDRQVEAFVLGQAAERQEMGPWLDVRDGREVSQGSHDRQRHSFGKQGVVARASGDSFRDHGVGHEMATGVGVQRSDHRRRPRPRQRPLRIVPRQGDLFFGPVEQGLRSALDEAGDDGELVVRRAVEVGGVEVVEPA